MGQQLNVPIYINGNNENTTYRELYMKETTIEGEDKKILECGPEVDNKRTNIRVAESEQSDKSTDVNNTNKLNTTGTDVEIGGTWKSMEGNNAEFSGISLDNNGTILYNNGIIKLNSSMYGTTPPTPSFEGQLFFVIPNS